MRRRRPARVRRDRGAARAGRLDGESRVARRRRCRKAEMLAPMSAAAAPAKPRARTNPQTARRRGPGTTEVDAGCSGGHAKRPATMPDDEVSVRPGAADRGASRRGPQQSEVATVGLDRPECGQVGLSAISAPGTTARHHGRGSARRERHRRRRSPRPSKHRVGPRAQCGQKSATIVDFLRHFLATVCSKASRTSQFLTDIPSAAMA